MQVESLSSDNQQLNMPISVTDLCKRVRFRQSECNVCVDICPVNAISLPFGPEISKECITCGLCQIACPTETFKGIPNADQMLMDLIQSQTDTKIINNKLHVHCNQAEPANNHSFALSCLGELSENSLLAITDFNVQQLIVTTGNCEECRLRQGKELFNQAANTYAQLSTMVPYAKISVKLREKPKKSQEKSIASRREFFRTITHSVTKQAAITVVKKEQQIRDFLQSNIESVGQEKRASPRREMLRELLDDLRGDSDDAGLGTELPWKKMIVDVVHCVGCGICVNVCPTGALIKETDSTELTRYINHALCTNCGVCAEACPQDVIRFDQSYGLNDLIADKLEVVAKVALNACSICGEIVPVSEGEVCTTCQKRQIVPLFM